ncbi:hypothetical protein [Pseudomonas serbica]
MADFFNRIGRSLSIMVTTRVFKSDAIAGQSECTVAKRIAISHISTSQSGEETFDIASANALGSFLPLRSVTGAMPEYFAARPHHGNAHIALRRLRVSAAPDAGLVLANSEIMRNPVAQKRPARFSYRSNRSQ